MSRNFDNNNSKITNVFTDLSLHIHSYETPRNSLTLEPSMQLNTAIEEYYYLSYKLKMLSCNYNTIVSVINSRNESEKKHLFFKDNNSSYPYIVHSLSMTASSVYNFLQSSSAFCSFIFEDQINDGSIFLDINFKKLSLNYSYQVDLNITIKHEIPTENFQKDGLLILEFFVVGKCDYTLHDYQAILKTYELFGFLTHISLHENFESEINLAKLGTYNISFIVDQKSEQFFVVLDSINAKNDLTPTYSPYKPSKDYSEYILPSLHFDTHVPLEKTSIYPTCSPTGFPTATHPSAYLAPPTKTHDVLKPNSIFKSFFYILNVCIKHISTMYEMITFSIAAFSQLCFGNAVKTDNLEIEQSHQSSEEDISDKNLEDCNNNADLIEEGENDFVSSLGFVISTALVIVMNTALSMYYYYSFYLPQIDAYDDLHIGIDSVKAIGIADVEDLV